MFEHILQDPMKTILPESDPSGKSPHTPGAKLDAGKLKPFLVLSEFAHALEKVTEVGTKGAAKYTERGWVSVDNGISRYKEAGGRHQLEEWKGEVIDTDTGCDHEAQVIWNLLASYELKLRKRKESKNAETLKQIALHKHFN